MMIFAAILSLVMGAFLLGAALHSLFSGFMPRLLTLSCTLVSIVGFLAAVHWFSGGSVRPTTNVLVGGYDVLVGLVVVLVYLYWSAWRAGDGQPRGLRRGQR